MWKRECVCVFRRFFIQKNNTVKAAPEKNGTSDPSSLFFMEQAVAPRSSTLAWKIPRMEGPGGLQSTGSLRVRYDWATSLSLFIFLHWRRKWQPTPVFLPGESQGRESLVGCRLWVAQSQTWLKWLSSSSRLFFLKKIAEARRSSRWQYRHLFLIRCPISSAHTLT